MKNKTRKIVVILIIIFSLLLVFTSIVNAQTPTPPTRDSLIQAIQQRAQKDVELGSAPQSPSDLAVLFSEQATSIGMSMNEVKDIYDEAYKAATPEVSSLEKWIKSQGGLIFLIVGTVLGALVVVFGKQAEKLFTHLLDVAYLKLARFRPFWIIALRRYRKSLENTYSELKIPFRSGRPLQMQDVYVPVRVEGGSKQQVDAYKTIQEHKQLVILGDPGSGKTMLLRNIAFTYAQQGLYDFPEHPIPVYLELNRVESTGNSLIDALTKSLENHNFPGADGFIKSQLGKKSLLILLDGLDEVNVSARPALVDQIKDLSQKYPGNRIIVTCRIAVYQGEIDDWVDQKLEIIEFSDQQIQRFMTSWQKDMPPEKSIEHFFRTLQERPQIMALARNPLLLTMVAYLYTDTEFALPHSRSEFYSRSTDLLLDQWKLERNLFKATHKRIVLQRLALFNQTKTGNKGERRTMELAEVLKEIQDVLPNLTLKIEVAQPLLDEIVQRSGLMLVIDGGTHYQFTHLTLQEYFAARALEADQQKLLDFYRVTPDAWREVARLWCALEHDSTAMLKELFALDPMMAFECLSDAQQVDNAYAEELIQSFQLRLHDAYEDDILASAFALLAADPRPRGKKWFEYIVSNLDNEHNRLAACSVLAHTNILQAADPLVKLAATESEVIPFLVQLGNLAVPALAEPAQMGEIWAMDVLVNIGTPKAALALEPLLWISAEPTTNFTATTLKEDERIYFQENYQDKRPYQAAWRLVALLSLSGVEDALMTIALTPEQRKVKQIEWIWEPFSDNVFLRIIIGRIAYLLHTSPEDVLPREAIPCDIRLVLPLCAIASQTGKLNKMDKKEYQELSKQIEQKIENEITLSNSVFFQKTLDEQKQRSLVKLFVDFISIDPVWKCLYSMLSITKQFALLKVLVQGDIQPSIDDWRNLLTPVNYNISTSWNVKTFKFLLLLLLPLNLMGIWKTNQINGWSIVMAIGTLVGVVVIQRATWTTNGLRLFCGYLCFGAGIVPGLIVGLLTHNWLYGILISLVCGALSGALGGNVLYGYGESVFPGASFIPFGDALVNSVVSAGGLSIMSGILSGALVFAIDSVFFSASLGSTLNNARNFVIDIIQNSILAIVVYYIILVVVIILVLVLIGVGLLMSILDIFLMYFATQFLYDLTGLSTTVTFWVVWLGCVYLLYFIGRYLERRSQNPLYGLFEPSDTATASRRLDSLLVNLLNKLLIFR